MKTHPYFIKTLQKRPYIQQEWCERVVRNPLVIEVQADGMVRFWGIVPELGGRALRVITLEDRETLFNAFLDRNFLKRYQKENPR